MLSINNGYTPQKTPAFAAKQQIHVNFIDDNLPVKTKDRIIKDAMEPLRQEIIEWCKLNPWDDLAHNPCDKADILYVNKDGLPYPYWVSGEHLKEFNNAIDKQKYLEFPSSDKDVHVIIDVGMPILDQVEVAEDPKTEELILKVKEKKITVH